MSDGKHTFTEEVQIGAERLKDTIQDLIREGNVRHILIRNAAGETVLDLPVSVGVIGLIIAPILAAVGAIAVLAGNYTIVVTREGNPTPPSDPDAPSA
ncbi:MAG: DUF4342 domain-containing protein [Fimbriimonas sp.]